VRAQFLDAGRFRLPAVVFQGQEAPFSLFVVFAVAGVVQHVGLEAAQRLSDGRQSGVVQVFDLDAASAHRLVQRGLDHADFFLGIQRLLVVRGGDDHQDAQGQRRGRRLHLPQPVGHPAEQEAAMQHQEILAVVQIFPGQPPQRRRVAVQGQGQAGLVTVAVVEFQEGFELLAVAEEETVEALAVGGQLCLLIGQPPGVGRAALDCFAIVARHRLLQHPLRLEVNQQVGLEAEGVAADFGPAAAGGHDQVLVAALGVRADLFDGDDDFGWKHSGSSRR